MRIESPVELRIGQAPVVHIAHSDPLGLKTNMIQVACSTVASNIVRAAQVPDDGQHTFAAGAANAQRCSIDELPADELQRDGADPVADAERKKERASAGLAAIQALFD